MNKNVAGWVLLVGGVIGLFVVYTLRPPQGVGDAFHMAISGKQDYIKEPLYSWLLIACFAAAVVGAAILARALMRKR
jgi:hypothetical protein